MSSIADIPHVQVFKSLLALHDENNKELLHQLKQIEKEHDDLKKNPFYAVNPVAIRVEQMISLNNQIQKNMLQVIEKAKEAIEFLEIDLVPAPRNDYPDPGEDLGFEDLDNNYIPDADEKKKPKKKGRPKLYSEEVEDEDMGGKK